MGRAKIMGTCVIGLFVWVPSALADGPASPQQSSSASATPVVAYQINPEHTGVTQDALPMSPTKAWSVTLDGARLSYPLIVKGIIYVIAEGPESGTKLYAVRASNGRLAWRPIELGPYEWP